MMITPISRDQLHSVQSYRKEYWPVWDTTCEICWFVQKPFAWLAYGFQLLRGTVQLPEPPSANGHGLLGSLPELAARNYEILDFLWSYQEAFGKKGLCKLKIGSKVFHIVSDPAIAQIILKKHASFSRGESLRVWRKFSPKGLNEGEETRAWRHQATRSIGQGNHSFFFPSIRLVAVQWTKRLEAFASSGEPFDVMREGERATLAALGESLFKIDPHNPDEINPFSLDAENDAMCFQFLDAFHHIFDLIARRIASSTANVPIIGDFLYSKIYSEEDAGLENAKTVLKDILYPIYKKLLSDPDSIPVDSHFYRLMQNFQIDIHNPDYDQMLDYSLGFLQAAFETSSKALGWTLASLAQHPKVQNKLASKLLKAYGSKLPKTREAFDKVPYLFQIIEETLRLYPPFPFLLRDIEDPQAYKDFAVHKGETFVVAPFFIHRNENYWNDPETFNPERFKPEMLTEKWQMGHPEYLPFLAGIHRCPGRFFAKQELALLLIQFFLNYRVSMDRSTKTPELKFSVTLQSKYPIHLTIDHLKK